ncbi:MULTISPECIES: hypothetical protein [unclassified Neisseria]|uniref:hypothetical protein n=1 Tax=unclassified Neisseria TaxID=2623750 RepID=UPI001072ACE5|nr:MULTISPECIES: hypothetical protein [unclassified Neisseria]MBF0803234.1 hypothetical protein [Neisseria sp. 19428wB4_WF04]TFU44074.1 hypothetical protein E4T99_02495 [Neisseria sp. WF04]
MYKTAFAASAVLLLAACSEPQPDKATFEKAINRYSAAQGMCMPLVLNVENGILTGAAAVGEPLVKIAERDSEGRKINESAFRQMRLLDKEGFYKQGRAETVPSPENGREIKVQVYELTDKGRAQARPGPDGVHFCIGALKVVKVNWFTEPTPADGVTVSKVSYEARLETAKWAERFMREGGSGWKHPDTTRNLAATMVKTNDGWRDIRELR